MCSPEESGASQRFCSKARPVSIERVICPDLLTNKMKKTYQWKKYALKHYRQNSNNLHILNKLESLQNHLTQSIAESKYNYYYMIAGKLNISQKSSKVYWSLSKRFLNNKKIPLILCSTIMDLWLTLRIKWSFRIASSQNSVLWQRSIALYHPILLIRVPSHFTYTTETGLETLEFSNSDIDKIIQALDSNKLMAMMKLVLVCSKLVIT